MSKMPVFHTRTLSIWKIRTVLYLSFSQAYESAWVHSQNYVKILMNECANECKNYSINWKHQYRFEVDAKSITLIFKNTAMFFTNQNFKLF